jgi:hypothetical protein
MAVIEKTMATLYGKLKTAGFNQKYIDSMLPEWWNKEIASTPSGFQEASIRLGAIFGVVPSSLRGSEILPELKLPAGHCFKRQTNHEIPELDVACALARSAARVVLNTLPKPPVDLPAVSDATAIRAELLKKHSFIDFSALLEYVWKIGIPVIYINHFPAKAKKMAGLAFEHDSRPVIVLTSRKAHGYLVFDLAHELAHIALGHVSNGQYVVDKAIAQDVDAEDDIERAANHFALALLTGEPDCKITPRGRHLSGPELAVQASRFGEDKQIDPFHVVLNYAHNAHGRWPVAQIAINLLANGSDTDQTIIRNTLLSKLKESDISDDNFLMLSRLTGEVFE